MLKINKVLQPPPTDHPWVPSGQMAFRNLSLPFFSFSLTLNVDPPNPPKHLSPYFLFGVRPPSWGPPLSGTTSPRYESSKGQKNFHPLTTGPILLSFCLLRKCSLPRVRAIFLNIVCVYLPFYPVLSFTPTVFPMTSYKPFFSIQMTELRSVLIPPLPPPLIGPKYSVSYGLFFLLFSPYASQLFFFL